jgi:hypothetical protein
MRLLKFDSIHPHSYLEKVKFDLKINNISREMCLNNLINLRSNFSDFYTHNLNLAGWQAEEFFLNNEYFTSVSKEMFGYKEKYKQTKEQIKNKIRPIDDRWNKKIIREYIKIYNPDVIFVREQSGFTSSFWAEVANGAMLVNRIACPIPKGWELGYWDLIYTSTEEYKRFFETQKVKTIINPNGFDERIVSELSLNEKQYEVTFVGGLGGSIFTKRTHLMEQITKSNDFKWWGYGNNLLNKNSGLLSSWQGITSGLEMFQIYKDSKIVLNDYGDLAEGAAVNQRIFEVLGVGSFLLTKYADNLTKDFPKDIFITFTDEKDCLDKINYYLKNQKEREEIALNGQKYVLEHFNYRKLMIEVGNQIQQQLQKKRQSL